MCLRTGPGGGGGWAPLKVVRPLDFVFRLWDAEQPALGPAPPRGGRRAVAAAAAGCRRREWAELALVRGSLRRAGGGARSERRPSPPALSTALVRLHTQATPPALAAPRGAQRASPPGDVRRATRALAGAGTRRRVGAGCLQLRSEAAAPGEAEELERGALPWDRRLRRARGGARSEGARGPCGPGQHNRSRALARGPVRARPRSVLPRTRAAVGHARRRSQHGGRHPLRQSGG